MAFSQLSSQARMTPLEHRKVEALDNPLETRACEIRFTSGRTLEGVALSYADTAQIGGGLREKFEPGAFSPVGDVVLNSAHDRTTPLARTDGGGLTISDGSDALRIRAVLPETSAANDTIALVKAGILRGLSVEFRATEEGFEDGVRIIEKAVLSGIAVVDSGAYPQSTVEARRKGRRTWIRGGIKYGIKSTCECLDGQCGKVMFRPEAFDRIAEKDVLAIAGRLTESLGSVFGASLLFKNRKDRTDFEITDAAKNTAAGQTITDLVDSKTAIYARPLIDENLSVFKDVDGVREFTTAAVSAILVKPIKDGENRIGWDPITADGTSTGFDRNRRSRIP